MIWYSSDSLEQPRMLCKMTYLKTSVICWKKICLYLYLVKLKVISADLSKLYLPLEVYWFSEIFSKLPVCRFFLLILPVGSLKSFPEERLDTRLHPNLILTFFLIFINVLRPLVLLILLSLNSCGKSWCNS